jgi:hypothetical protein
MLSVASDGAKHCLDALNFGMAKAHLNAAEWHCQQAKKAIAVVGQAKNQKPTNSQPLGWWITSPRLNSFYFLSTL